MYILGISAFYHDSAACLLKDGEIVAAAQEERFTRKKHDASFPSHAIQYCLEEAGIFVMGGMKIDQLNIDGLDHASYDARDLTDPAEDSGKGAAQKWKVDNLPKELVVDLFTVC